LPSVSPLSALSGWTAGREPRGIAAVAEGERVAIMAGQTTCVSGHPCREEREGGEGKEWADRLPV